MYRILFLIIFMFNFSYSAKVEELSWPKGESFLGFLQKHSISQKFYFDLDKEDQELCSEIDADQKYFLYTNDDGSLNQALIPISDEIQIHIYKNSKNEYKFETLPIDYTENTQIIALKINESVSQDILNATGDGTLGSILKSVFQDSSVNFRKMQKGDFVALKYTSKTYLGKPFGTPELIAAMVQIAGKSYYRFKNEKDDKYYDEKGDGFTKTFFFQVPITYQKISSEFTNKRWHPILQRYRAHLGTDFAAPIGRNIYSAGDGRVEFVGEKEGYGRTIIINHGNGYKTLYGHQSAFAKGISSSKSVKKGELIGYVGNSGLSSGPHLHFGMYKNNVAVDPMPVLNQPKVDGLEAREKAAFLSNAQAMIKKFEAEMKNDNKTMPTKVNNRTSMKSDVNIF